MSQSSVALAAELSAQLESAQERIAELEGRLQAIIDLDPDEAKRWATRAMRAEELLDELMGYWDRHPPDLLPEGFLARLAAQRNAATLHRLSA